MLGYLLLEFLRTWFFVRFFMSFNILVFSPGKLEIYNFGLISFKIKLLDDKTTKKTGNHLYNKIYSLNPTVSRTIQKNWNLRKFLHFISVLWTLDICLLSLNIIYGKHHPALSRIVLSQKDYYDSRILFLQNRKGISSSFFNKVDFIERRKLLVQCCLLKNIWQLSFEAVTIK